MGEGDVSLHTVQNQTVEQPRVKEEVSTSNVFGRIYSNLNGVKEKFENVAQLFKGKIGEIKEFFDKKFESVSNRFSKSPVNEKTTHDVGEKIFKNNNELAELASPDVAHSRSKNNDQLIKNELHSAHFNNPLALSRPPPSSLPGDYGHVGSGAHKTDAPPTPPPRNDIGKAATTAKERPLPPLPNDAPKADERPLPPLPSDAEENASSTLNEQAKSHSASSPSPSYIEPSAVKPSGSNTTPVPSPVQEIGKIFTKIFVKGESLSLEKSSDQTVRNYTAQNQVGQGNYSAAVLVNKAKTVINAAGEEIKELKQRVLLVTSETVKEQKTNVDLHNAIKVNKELQSIAKEDKKAGNNTLPHVAIAKPVEFEGEVVFSLKFMNGGSVDKRLENVSDQQKKYIVEDMTKGVQELHKKGICHRDIKMDNFLMDDSSGEMIVKIADMGKAFFESDGSNPTALFGPIVPPEIQVGNDPWTKKSDVYQLGVAIFMTLTGQKDMNGMRAMMAPNLTTDERKDITLVRAARNENLKNGKWIGMDKLDGPTKNFITRMCDSDPNNRPNIDEVVNFFSENQGTP